MQPSNRTIIGVALLLFGSVLLGVGIHHVVSTGTCSSTGYSSNYGPVPYCPKGTGWWILFVVGGILLGVVGGLVSGGSSALLITPAIFLGIGIGSLSILLDAHVKSGAKTFGAIFGGAFAFFGVVPLLVVGIGALTRGGRSRTPPSPFSPTALQSDPIMGSYASTPRAASAVPAGLGSLSSPSSPGSAASGTAAHRSGDALDKIEKLAKLREQGALTEDEFNREKTKLLTEL